ncbi:MAG: YhcG family protein [Saprospiraceae bacterium]
MHTLYHNILQILQNARVQAARAVNFAMVEAYWEIGRMIIEEEQQGKYRAEYGKNLLQYLSQRLTSDFGKGFNETNLKYIRQFYSTFPNRHALRDQLSWTHYRALLRVENPSAREFYIAETIANNWGTRALDRQINSLYYERILSSGDRTPVAAEMQEKTRELSPEDVLKDPYVLEFLQLKENKNFVESELEQALIDKLQEFLLELGKGFAFVARQKRISTETKHFYVDLVFYNYLLKCFVLIDLKTTELSHQDIGQMDMYVRLYEDKYKGPDDNPTIGLILCTHKDHTIAKYSVLNDSKQLFAAKYMLYLPTEEELQIELEREKSLIEQAQKLK